MLFSSGVRRIVLATLALLSLVVPSAIAAAPTAAGPTVVSVSISGNVHVPEDRILAVLKTKAGEPFDPATVQADLRSIADLGYFADQAPPIIKQRPGGVAVTFRVIENPVITRITFQGNAHVPSDTLLALMDTAVGQVFNSNTFHQDVLKINSYYDKIGYGGQVPTHVKDLNIAQSSGVLTLSVQEGLTVRNVTISGDHVINDNVIRSSLSVKPGTPYSEEARDKDADTLRDLYHRYDLQIGDFEAGIDPASVDLKAGTADVNYKIDVAKVGAIEITGNTITHDDVVRRELRLQPGMYITESSLRRDYERLNNLGFFDKVELNPKPGPDPKNPAAITLDWAVKEQRTGTAQIGAGYSGGLTGEGLTGTLSYSQNNINGTGDGASVRFEKGSRTTNAQLSATVPYLGRTPQSQKYSLGVTVFTNSLTNYYPVYAVPTAAPSPTAVAPTAPPINSAQGVSIVPVDANNPNQISGVASTYYSSSTGVSATLGRRFTDYFRGSVGLNIEQVSTNATVPSPYFFATSSGSSVLASNSLTNDILGQSVNGNQALGVTAPSIANLSGTRPYNLHSVVFGLSSDTRDDVYNPRVGLNTSISDEVSTRGIGSDFNYTIVTFDAAKFFPVARNATLGFHSKIGQTSGAIPPNRLFTLSDQELRGYRDVFYGTELVLLQGELRVPLSPDKKFSVAGFVETGGTRIRGASPSFDVNGNPVSLNNYQFHSDVGVGLRFDVPQLGLRTLRLDFARGSEGAHTAFGIGQSF